MFFLTELSALEKCLIFNVAHACLWSELLRHFLLDWFQTWNVSSLQRVDVRDIFFEIIMSFLAELSALDKYFIINIAHACVWSQLLQHFLPDWFQTWHVSSVPRVHVRDIFLRRFFLELSALEKYCIFNIAHACLWSELLPHFLPDRFQIWNMSSSGRVDVRDIYFPYELSALGISLIFHISHACL